MSKRKERSTTEPEATKLVQNTPELVRENSLASLDLLVERLLQLTETLESRKQGVPEDREVCQCCSILWRAKVGHQLPVQQQQSRGLTSVPRIRLRF